MPAKTILIPKATFLSFADLSPVLAQLILTGKITKSQYAGIISLCSGAYPCDVEIAQRTPKEIIYISVNGESYTINNRAKTKLLTKNYAFL